MSSPRTRGSNKYETLYLLDSGSGAGMTKRGRWRISADENMPGTPYDPSGHTKIAVFDYKKSYLFYKDIFEQLDYKQVSNKDNCAGWASLEGYAILIAQATIPNNQYIFGAPGLHHICLKARSTEMVDELYQSLLKKKVFIKRRIDGGVPRLIIFIARRKRDV